MRLDFFMLADAATASEGKLFIHGGGITNVAVPAVPFVQPQIACALRIEIEPADEGKDHTIDVRLVSPDGEVVAGPAGGPLPAHEIPPRKPDEPIFASAALTIGSLRFDAAGPYRMEVLFDGEVVGSQPLVVRYIESLGRDVQPAASPR